MSSYLDNLIAARDALVAALTASASGLTSYSLDGESWSRDTGMASQIKTLNELIIMEQNRVSGRRELCMVRGRRYVGWY